MAMFTTVRERTTDLMMVSHHGARTSFPIERYGSVSYPYSQLNEVLL